MKIILTFDDGLKSHLNFVAPLLLEHKLPATFFISGISCQRGFCGREKVMDWNGVSQLHQQGFEIGHHLFDHDSMCEISDKKIMFQIKRLDDKLREIEVTEPVSFSYPGFSYSFRVMNLLRKRFKYARSGCEKTVPFHSFQEGASGSPFNPIWDNPMNINCLGVFGKNYQYDDFVKDLDRIEDDYGIFCFHGFGTSDRTSVPKSCLNKVVEKLIELDADVMAMKDIQSNFESGNKKDIERYRRMRHA